MSNNISSRSFMNRLKKNPAVAFGVLIAVVGIIALVWWFVSRGKKDGTPKKSEGPSIAIGVEKVRLHPANKKVEEYAVYEYDTGTTTASAKNIDITISWTNGAGFKDITGLRFYRTSNNKTYYNDVIDKDKLIDYEKGRITFRGADIPTGTVDRVTWTDPTDFIGDNVFTVAYEKDGNWTVFQNTNATTNITQNMLNRTLDLSTVSDVYIQPLQNTSGFVASHTIGPRTYYSVYDYYGNVITGLSGIRFDYDSTGSSMKFKNSTFGDIEIVDNITNYKFEKYTDNTYLISFTNASNQVEYLFKQSDGTIGTHTKTTAFSGTEALLNATRFQIIQDGGSETVEIRTTSSTTPATTSSATPLTYVHYSGKDRWYGDMDMIDDAGFTQKYLTGKTLEQCQQLCTEKDTCVGISYGPNYCYNKKEENMDDFFRDATATNWYAKSRGYTMGPAGQDRSGHTGGDMSWDAYDGTTDTSKTGITLEACEKACTAVDDCIGISYNESTKRCFMKNKSAEQLAPSTNGFQWYAKNPL